MDEATASGGLPGQSSVASVCLSGMGEVGSGRIGCIFSDRRGGRSVGPYRSLNLGAHVGDDPLAVAANRRLLAARCGLPPEQVRYMDQVHGDRVAVISAGHAAPVGGIDAQVTNVAGTVLAVLVADCVPVVLGDAGAGVVGVAHAGRRGVAAGVVLNALAAMVDLGARPDHIRARLGPAVCGQCYEVPPAMRAEVSAAAPAAWATTPHGMAGLDLRAGLAAQLTDRGVRVTCVGPCTAESADHFSYRRDGVTGRFAALVWLAR